MNNHGFGFPLGFIDSVKMEAEESARRRLKESQLVSILNKSSHLPDISKGDGFSQDGQDDEVNFMESMDQRMRDNKMVQSHENASAMFIMQGES